MASETTTLSFLLYRTDRLDHETARRAATSIVRDAKTLGRIAVRDCNGEPVSPEMREREGRCMVRVGQWCRRFGLGAHFNGDPRGFPVKVTGLTDVHGRPAYNTWGGASDGWGIGTA